MAPITEPPSRKANVPAAFPRRALVIRAGLALVLGFALWWGFRDAEPPPPVAPLRASEPAPSAPPVLAPAAVTSAVPSPARSGAYETANDGIPIRGPGAIDDSDAELRHPHPITPAHERIFKENNMIGALNAAMDLGNVAELRRLNREYRDQYPEDSHLLQTGYDLIADCMERRTAATRVAAERFYDTQIASTLRRYVRIHCLEETPP